MYNWGLTCITNSRLGANTWHNSRTELVYLFLNNRFLNCSVSSFAWMRLRNALKPSFSSEEVVFAAHEADLVLFTKIAVFKWEQRNSVQHVVVFIVSDSLV